MIRTCLESLLSCISLRVCSNDLSSASLPLVRALISSFVSNKLSLSFATTTRTSLIYFLISSLLSVAKTSLMWGTVSLDRPISQLRSLLSTTVCPSFNPLRDRFLQASGPMVGGGPFASVAIAFLREQVAALYNFEKKTELHFYEHKRQSHYQSKEPVTTLGPIATHCCLGIQVLQNISQI